MKKTLTLLALAAAMTLGSAHAASSQQNKMKTCNAEAKTKELKGDERKAFMKTCLSAKADDAAATPDAAAEKPKGEQKNKMKTCNADAKAKELKGDERKAFMKDCLSNK